MAGYGEQYQGGRTTDEYGNPVRQTDEYGNPVHHTAGTMGDYGTTGIGTGATGTAPVHHTGDYGTTGVGTGATHETGHGTGVGGVLQRSGSSSSSSSEDDGMGGRRKKKGIKEKIKEKLPGGHKDDPAAQTTSTTVPGAAPYEGGYAPQEKKGMIEKIKEKLPGSHAHAHHILLSRTTIFTSYKDP